MNFVSNFKNLAFADDIDGVDIVLVPSQKFKNSNSNKGRAKSPLVRDDSDSDYDDDSEDEPSPKKRTNKKPAAKKPAVSTRVFQGKTFPYENPNLDSGVGPNHISWGS